MDPKLEKMPNYGTYVYCLNNPIILLDPDGKYPNPILIFHPNKGLHGTYNFRQATSYLLSLVSGVSEGIISNVTIQKRAAGQFRPFYSSYGGGGGITLGSSSANANITYTENFFDDNPESYKNKYIGDGQGHGYGQDIKTWLGISAHQVGHLPQIDKAGGLLSYLGEFVNQYSSSGNHNGAPYEVDADKGTGVFRDFNKFVDKKYGKDKLINIMKATEEIDGRKGSEGYKIKQIDKFWKEYEKSAEKTN